MATYTHLTTAALSNHSHGNPTLALTNLSGTTASNSAGLTLSLSAGAGGAGDGVNIIGVNGNTVGSNDTVQFSNGNNVTFGLNGSTVTASASYPAQTAYVFSNSNGVSWGTNGSTVTATVATNYQSQGAYLTTAMLSNAATISNINVSAGTTSSNLSNITFANANGISFGLGTGASTGSITASHNGLTTARASTDAVGLNTALTAGPLAWTVNSSGISLNAGSAAGTTSGFGGNLISGSMTHNTAGLNLSLNHPSWLTTAAQSDHSHGNPQLNLTNLSGTTASNSAGFTLSLSAAAPGGGADVVASASNGAFTFTTLGFSNANNVTFGTSAGSIITASVAAPGAAAENNAINLLGANTAGNTTATGSTIGYSGVNLTLSGTNNSQVVISAPATSSLSAVNGFFISANASTISMGQTPNQFFEPVPLMSTLTSTFAPGIGTWHFQPFNLAYPLASGRMNFLVSHGSTSNLLNLSNGANFASNTTGGRSLSFNHSYMAALYTRGAGANSTRWDSIWSNTWGLSISHSVGVSVTNASQITHSQQLTMNFVSQVGTDGAYTLGGTGQSHSQSTAASTVATTAFTSGRSSWQNMVSGALLIPMGFNTSIPPGDYLLGLAYSTASTTAGTSINGASIWPVVNWMGFNQFASFSHRQFASTASSTGSQYYMPVGIFSVASASAPATINPRDIRSLSNNVFPYVNFMQSNFN